MRTTRRYYFSLLVQFKETFELFDVLLEFALTALGVFNFTLQQSDIFRGFTSAGSFIQIIGRRFHARQIWDESV